MKIQITSKSKINNPVDNVDNIYQFEGDFNDEMFLNSETPQYPYLKTQSNNYQEIKQILNRMNLQFERIWIGTMINDFGSKSYNFVIKSNVNDNGDQIFWQKYISKNPGSGQNKIFITNNDKSDKMKLESFFFHANLNDYDFSDWIQLHG